MIDDNPPSQELPSSPPAAGGLGVFQFSLMSMFVITTVVALILSAFFSVGRLVGMSPVEVLSQGLGRFVYVFPTMLVWFVGMTMAIRRRKRNRLPAILTMLALGGLSSTWFVLSLAEMSLIHCLSIESLSWIFAILGGLYAIANTICWILILMAIFARRPADARQT